MPLLQVWEHSGEVQETADNWAHHAPHHDPGKGHCCQICAIPPGRGLCCREGVSILPKAHRGGGHGLTGVFMPLTPVLLLLQTALPLCGDLHLLLHLHSQIVRAMQPDVQQR